jgi:HSP20 family protein
VTKSWPASAARGPFARQLFLGDGLDTDQIHATYENGVLTVTVPIADGAKPRRVEVSSESHRQAIDANAHLRPCRVLGR